MKHLHYDGTTGATLGWFDTEIHDSIPTPNVAFTEEDYSIALDAGFNRVDPITFVLSVHDFSTPAEQQEIINAFAIDTLRETDWYFIRFLENGTPVPPAIIAERVAARASIVLL